MSDSDLSRGHFRLLKQTEFKKGGHIQWFNSGYVLFQLAAMPAFNKTGVPNFYMRDRNLTIPQNKSVIHRLVNHLNHIGYDV